MYIYIYIYIGTMNAFELDGVKESEEQIVTIHPAFKLHRFISCSRWRLKHNCMCKPNSTRKQHEMHQPWFSVEIFFFFKLLFLVYRLQKTLWKKPKGCSLNFLKDQYKLNVCLLINLVFRPPRCAPTVRLHWTYQATPKVASTFPLFF